MLLAEECKIVIVDTADWIIREKDGWSEPLSNHPKHRVFKVNVARGTGWAEYEYLHSCSRCGGAGGAEQWRHTGYTCFDCGGRGKWMATKTVRIYSPERNAILQAAMEARQEDARLKRKAEFDRIAAEKEAARKVKDEAFRAAHPDLCADLEELWETNEFLRELNNKRHEWGDLTEKQVEAAQREIAKVREAQRRSRDGQWVGEVGQRIEVNLTTEHVIDLGPSQFNRYAHNYLVLMVTDEGNVVTYKGGSHELPSKGERGKIRATVAEHTWYKGTRQTVISRPKDITPAEQETCE